MEETKTRIVTDGKFFKVQILKKPYFPKFLQIFFGFEKQNWEDLKEHIYVGYGSTEYSPILFSYISEAQEARREFIERKNPKPKQWRVVDE